MNKTLALHFQSLNWNKILRVMLMAALLLPLLALRPTPGVTPRAQPALLALAATRPDQVVSVIVQKAVKDAAAEEGVARLGGRVTRDLHIINAMTAVLPALGGGRVSQVRQCPLGVARRADGRVRHNDHDHYGEHGRGSTRQCVSGGRQSGPGVDDVGRSLARPGHRRGRH